MSLEIVPTDRELQALKVLWSAGKATVREVWTEMNRDDAQLAYTTVLSLLQVMEQKGLVDHERVGKAYAYFPRVKRETTYRDLAQGFLQRVFDGAVEEYLVHALPTHGLSDEELKRLETLIADAKTRRRSNGGKER